MAQAAPPVGYDLSASGAWNTDAEEDTAVFKTGNASVKFNDTNLGDDLYLYIPAASRIPCAAGDLLRVGGWVRAANLAADYILWVYWYNAAGAALGVSWVVGSEYPGVDVVNTWEFKTGIVQAPPPGTYATEVASWSVWFGTLSNGNGVVRWDSVFVEAVTPACSAYDASGAAYAASAGTKIVLDTEEFDYGANFDAAANYRFTAPRAGRYSVSVYSVVDTLNAPDATFVGVIAYKNGVALRAVMYEDANTAITLAGPIYVWVRSFAETMLLAAGDYLELYITHDDTNNLTFEGTSRFSIVGLD